MQLNNKTNGNMVRISKIYPNKNKVVYSLLNPNEYVVKEENYKFDTINLLDYMGALVNYTSLSYETLNSEVFSDSLVLENDTQNWLHSTRDIRMYIPKDLVLNSIEKKDDLSVIINRMVDENELATEKFIFIDTIIVTVYINEVLPEDASVIQPYIDDGIIVLDNKIV